jgi:DNA-binding winged helix-turn-helix (wHTH) protein
MDFAKRTTGAQLLTTAELAARDDFTLGGVIVSPSTRSLRGPNANTDLEPRVMQVLVVLADSAGQVVTRATLFDRCWGLSYVGDDSLNRAVASVRRAAAVVGGRFEVETIPRTGYRLTVPKGKAGKDGAEQPTDDRAGTSRRRALIYGGAVAVVGASGFWWSERASEDARFDALMRTAEDAVRKQEFGAKTEPVLRQALAIKPGSAKAWGMLALLKSILAQAADPKRVANIVSEAENAAQKSLSIDRREPHALLAMFELQGSTLDWTTRDKRLRQIIAIDPGNLLAIGELILLLQAAGLTQESFDWNERALTMEPLSIDFLGKRALKFWIAGRVTEADKVIDQLRALYPMHPWVWWIRFLILALTGRPRAAEAMLDAQPQMLVLREELELWRTSLAALEQRSATNLTRARDACFEGARRAGGVAGVGVMILSALGDVDSAFAIANGFLLSRGPVVRGGEPHKQDLPDAAWRINTQWLFTPPVAVMRRDARFLSLCDAMGLVEYWRRRAVTPDFLLKRA